MCGVCVCVVCVMCVVCVCVYIYIYIYIYNTWFFLLPRKHCYRIFEERRRVKNIGTRREQTGGKIIIKGEFRSLHFLPNIIRIIQ